MNNSHTSENKVQGEESLKNEGNVKLKHVFSNRIYMSHPEWKQNPFFKMYSLKSHSMTSLEENTINDYTKTDNGSDNEELININCNQDSYTQTSKTILQLAQIENRGNLSPDSLMQSPKNIDVDNLNITNLDMLPTKEIRSDLKMPLKSEENIIINDIIDEDKISFTRKGNLLSYFNEIQEQTFPNKTLTETFLKKNKTSKYEDNIYQFERELKYPRDSRSKFLQQISPFQNISKEPTFNDRMSAQLKSRSYVEPYNFSLEKFKQNEYIPPRFSVKSIKETFNNDNNTPLRYYCQKEVHAQNSMNDTIVNNFSEVQKNPAKACQHKNNSFMSPTIASTQKNKLYEINNLNSLISPTRKGRSASPDSNINNNVERINLEKVPYIDESESELGDNQNDYVEEKHILKEHFPINNKPNFENDLQKIDGLTLDLGSSEETLACSLRINDSCSTTSADCAITIALNKLKNHDWIIGLQGLAEIVELCRLMDAELIYVHMTFIQQKLIELLKSPRSHVCRTACQAAGHLFESMKDTRRPEFDDIVDILLFKTADSNKFIRQDANLSLDCMVTHIPTFHAIRALSAKGPGHKNNLVRTASARLIVCAVVIAGADTILNINGNDNTRKRVILNMQKFLEDKNLETRKYGERLYKVLCKDKNFDIFLKKYLEKEQIIQMKKNLKLINNKK